MSLRTILVLMIVFIVLGSFAIFDPLRRAEKNDEKKERESHVVWLKDKKLEGLRIVGKNPATELICAIKDGCPFDGKGEWNMNQPVEGHADASAAATLASTILNLRHNERLEFPGAAPDPKEFGLDQPNAELTVKLKGEPPMVLKFGKSAAVGPNVYLSVSSEPTKIFLVPSYVTDMVNKDSFHWQNKRILPNVESTGFTRLGWKNKKIGELRAYKMDGLWRMDRPIAALASQVMLEGLASTVSYASAKSIFSPWRGTVEAKGLLKGKPELEIGFSTADGNAHEVKLFAKPGHKPGTARELVAVVDKEPVMFNLEASVFDRFQKDLLEYRQRSVLDDNVRAQVDEARFSFPREKLEAWFKLEGSQWKYVSGAKPTEAISSVRFNGFLDGLRDADFKGFFPVKGNSAEAKAFRTQTPDLHVELKGGGKLLLQAAFVVFNRSVALTSAENDVRSLGDSFLRVLPVRLSDLNESSNKQVVVKEEKKAEDSDGAHDHSSH